MIIRKHKDGAKLVVKILNQQCPSGCKNGLSLRQNQLGGLCNRIPAACCQSDRKIRIQLYKMKILQTVNQMYDKIHCTKFNMATMLLHFS